MDIRPLDPDDLGTMKQVVDLENATEAHDAPWRHPMTLRIARRRDPLGLGPRAGPSRGGARRRHDGRPRHPGAQRARQPRPGLVRHLGPARPPPPRLRLRDAAPPGGRGARGRPHQGRRRTRWDGSPGADFAAAHGYPKRFQSINRRQHLDEVSLDKVRALYDDAAAAAADYELVLVEGRTPPEMLDSMVDMVAAINDAPLDDLDIEDEVFSADRVAAYETAQLNAGPAAPPLPRAAPGHR